MRSSVTTARAGKCAGKSRMCAGARRAEAVDRLEVVADDGHVRPWPARRPRDDVDLQAVDVLVLVDEHVVERPRPVRRRSRSSRPARASRAAGRRGRARRARACAPVGAEERRDRLAVLLAPREGLVEHLRQRPLRVDRARVDVEQRRLAREARVRSPRARAPRAGGRARRRRRRRRARRSPARRPERRAWRRTIRCATEWNVPPSDRAGVRRHALGQRRARARASRAPPGA